MFQCYRSPRSNTITIPNTLQRALSIQNIQLVNCQDWFSINLLFYTECLDTVDGICYHKCRIQATHEDHCCYILLCIRDIPKYSNASETSFPYFLSFSLFLKLAFYNHWLLSLHIHSPLILDLCKLYYCFTGGNRMVQVPIHHFICLCRVTRAKLPDQLKFFSHVFYFSTSPLSWCLNFSAAPSQYSHQRAALHSHWVGLGKFYTFKNFLLVQR